MSACPVCAGPMRSFLGPVELPVFCNVLHQTVEAARAAPRGTVELAICERCSMISNVAFDEQLAAYGGGYENALHFSAVFREFAEGVASRLVERYDVRGSRVVEVGCGDGHFLGLVCAAGGNRGLGYDPSRPASRESTANGGEYTIVPESYGPGVASGEARLVSARHVLEHVADPHAFVGALREASGDAVLYVEVPDGEYMLREHAFWDVIYEHCSYFSAASMAELLEREGYAVLAAESGFGGQYLGVEARPAQPPPAERGSRPEGPALGRLAERFDAARRAEIERWDARLGELDGTVVLWGAGSKGVTLACELEHADRIAAAVDVNPRKVGLHLPVTGIPVVAPAALADDPPAHVLVMNRNYVDEIASALKDLGHAPRLWTA